MGKADSRGVTDNKVGTISAGRMAISKERPGPTDTSLAMVPSKVPGVSNLARTEGAGHRAAVASDSRREIVRVSAAARAVTCGTAGAAVPTARFGATSILATTAMATPGPGQDTPHPPA